MQPVNNIMTSNPTALLPAISSLRGDIALTTQARRRLSSVLLTAKLPSQAAACVGGREINRNTFRAQARVLPARRSVTRVAP
jgi:hypothetical protein